MGVFSDVTINDLTLYKNEESEEEREQEMLYYMKHDPTDQDMLNEFLRVAKKHGDVEAAANVIRRRRNAFLMQSDKEVSLDRLNLTIPKGVLFSDWISFFRQIAQMLTGDWAKYRQALRDIPQQEGFPFNITWPDKPEG